MTTTEPSTVSPPFKLPKPAEIAKALTALAGLAGLAITNGLVSGTAQRWVNVIIGAATVIAVYLVPNAQSGSTAAADEEPEIPPFVSSTTTTSAASTVTPVTDTPPTTTTTNTVPPSTLPGQAGPHGGGPA